ncbi:MAG: hypothetical protein IPP02_06085 [Chitinophagaceae bacterium]|jgi:hypothetical protein|nr:hypothetical protein [Chitinophagaceae bacterium]MBK7679626.1 hypothetical protein [Chitinophagaceae bacterium]MBK8299021.1 hypothetical protein [Chitinophagaceae bacterium]MBK9659797.1 hypothetical protein [Chitinophagaceae bacterium]MBK9937950.1 hypothetical protein [Chitinophagaceae bacterium]
MNLKETILSEHSKANCNRIVKWIGNNPERFDELFNLFLHDEYGVVQRAAWPLSYLVIDHPQLIHKHFSKLLKYVKKSGLHDAVKRNTVRLLQEIDIPKKYHGEVMNLCFDYIISPVEKPAVKASSLTILANLSKEYPDIKQELKTIIEDRWNVETAAFRARGKKILKSLS